MYNVTIVNGEGSSQINQMAHFRKRSKSSMRDSENEQKEGKKIARLNGNDVSFIDAIFVVKYSCRNRGYQISVPIDTQDRSILSDIVTYRLTGL